MDRQIRLFVSSTFLDMQDERNALARACFPSARRLFAGAGMGFSEIDLRWGLSETETEASIVDLCMDEVERCRGYFIGILGSRYGYVPATDAAGRSITELEIRKGAFEASPSSFVRFYFKRDAHDDQPALTSLKTCIREKFAVAEYASPQHLVELLLADLAALAEGIAAQSQTPPLTSVFAWQLREPDGETSRPGMAALDSFLLGKDRFLRVLGPSGSGKTTLVSAWFSQRRGAAIDPPPGIWRRLWRYIRHFGAPPRLRSPLWLIHCAGDLTGAAGLSTMLDVLVPQLRAALGDPAPVHSMLLKDRLLAFHRLLGRAAAVHEGIILVIDDADALLLDTVLPFHWLPPKIGNVKLILSGRSSGAVAQLDDDWRSVDISGLDKDQQAIAMRRYLQRFGKALPPDLAACLLATGLVGRPLALRLAADELRLAESPAHLAHLVQAFRHVRDTVDLFGHVLDRLEREHGRPLVGTVCGLLACSRGGLWETELRTLVQEQLAVSPVQWSSIVQAFSKSVIDQDGLYALHFEELQRAVQARYLQEAEQVALHRAQLVGWLQRARAQEQLPLRRIVEELPWQLCQAQDWTGLLALLIDPHFFVASWRLDPSQVIAWWRLIEKHCGVKAADAWNKVLAVSEQVPVLQAVLALLYAELGDAQAAVGCVRYLLGASAAGVDASFSCANLLNLAGFLMENEQADAAAEALDLAATLLPRITNEVLRASYRNACGNLALSRRQPLAAMGSYREAEALYAAARNAQAVAECSHNQALVMLETKQYADAARLLKHCAATFRAVHDIELLCKTLISLAIVQERSGKLGIALKSAQQAQALARERHDWQLLCKALQASARIQELSGDRDGAERDYVECEQCCRLHGDRRREIDVLLARAVVRINLGQAGYRAAAGLVASAAQLAASAGSPVQRVRIGSLQQQLGERHQHSFG